MSLLALRHLQLAIAGQPICQDLQLEIQPGECWGILGRNGVGKTTLLQALAGLRTPDGGEILLQNRPLTALPRQQVARQIGVLFQDNRALFPASVLESTLIGRHPWLKRWQWEGREDVELALAALRTVDLEDLAARDVTTLSGGEYQRLQIATLLTQNPTLSLLDEPINHLDLHHQISILKTLTAELAARAQAVIMVLHDINLAARFCDHLLLLFGNGQSCQGAPAAVLTGEHLQKLYGHPLQRLELNGHSVFIPE